MTKKNPNPMMARETFTRGLVDLMNKVFDDGLQTQRSFLPLSSYVDIKPAEMAPISAMVQIPFRGDRFAVWSVCAPSFMINTIKVGNRALDVCCGDAPADAFATRLDLLPMLDQQLDEHGFVQIKISRKADECFGQPIAMPRAHVGCQITVYVTNVSDKPMRFVSTILGDAEQAM